nr:Zgc:65749 [Danio rerio]
MVFFTCDGCGESLKKAQVEKHLLKCRSCHVLSCIDCGADFRGDDYKSHNRCISEDQKYGGRDFQARANKGDLKQQQWIERVQEAVSRPDVGSELQQVLRRLSVYENVPRKKAKFENWMRNCLKIHSPHLLKQVWEILSTAADSNGKPASRETTENCESRTDLKNGTEEEEDQRKKKKKKNRKTLEEQNGHEKHTQKQKRKREQNEQNTDGKNNKRQKKSKQEEPDESLNEEGEEPDNQETEPNSTAGKFNWKGTIKAVLRDAPEEGLAVKKLRKKVLAAYYSFSGDRNYRSEEELLSLFNRKINTNPKFKILKDRVRLLK